MPDGGDERICEDLRIESIDGSGRQGEGFSVPDAGDEKICEEIHTKSVDGSGRRT